MHLRIGKTSKAVRDAVRRAIHAALIANDCLMLRGDAGIFGEGKGDDSLGNKEDSWTAVDAAAIAAISTALGFPVPPSLARNLIVAVGTLVTAAADIPKAWLDSVATNVRTTVRARAKVIEGPVPTVIDNTGADSELKSRATKYLGGRMLREQANREAVAAQTLQELRLEAQENPSELNGNPEPIDEDWLNIFGKLAESRSDQAMRAYFARILAGEIRRPGSFAPATLEVLSRMMNVDALNFQRLCALVAEFRYPESHHSEIPSLLPCIIAEPYGNPGDDKLGAVGFNHSQLAALQEAGLVQNDFNARRHYDASLFLKFETWVGSTKLSFAPVERSSSSPPLKAKCMKLTRAGRELRGIARVGTNDEYVDKLVGWITTTFNLRLVTREKKDQTAAES